MIFNTYRWQILPFETFEKEDQPCLEVDCCLCTSEKTHQTKTSFAPLKMMMIEVGDSRKRNEQATG